MEWKEKLKQAAGKGKMPALLLVPALLLLAALALRLREDGIRDAFSGLSVWLLLLTVIVMLVGCLAVSVWKWNIDRVFLLTVPALAVVYMVLLPPYLVPDEVQHFNKAYAISDQIMGIAEGSDGTILMRKGDAGQEHVIRLSRELYEGIREEGWFMPEEEKELVSVDRVDMKPACYYIPAGIGITIGRCLGLNTVPTYQLARLMNLILFVAMGWLSIRLLPFGKNLVLLISLLPITLQQVMSVSYDSILLALSLFAAAMTLHLAWAEKIRTGKAASLGAALFLICLAKYHAYFLMAFLPVIIWLRRKPLPAQTRKKIGRAAGIGAVILIVGMAAAWLLIDIPYEPGGHILAYTGTEGVSLAYLWNHPSKIFGLLYYTFYLKADHYFYTSLGGLLGWLDIPILHVLCVAMFGILIAGALRAGEEECRVSKGERNVLWLIALGCFACCLAGMALSWTPLDAASIEGVQGRYFLPFFLLLFLPLRRLPLKFEKDPTAVLVSSMLLIQVLAVNQIMMSVL